jgi:hypothetical protein
MSTITITGSYHTLLTHCALWGTASILANDLGSSGSGPDGSIPITPRSW